RFLVEAYGYVFRADCFSAREFAIEMAPITDRGQQNASVSKHGSSRWNGTFNQWRLCCRSRRCGCLCLLARGDDIAFGRFDQRAFEAQAFGLAANRDTGAQFG